MAQQHNYFAHGGTELVIGGKLTFLPGAVVEGADEVFDVSTDLVVDPEPHEFPDSTAGTVAGLRQDFNDLLATLRECGVLAPATNSEPADDDE